MFGEHTSVFGEHISILGENTKCVDEQNLLEFLTFLSTLLFLLKKAVDPHIIKRQTHKIVQCIARRYLAICGSVRC